MTNYTHYKSASDFKAFVNEVIEKENLTVTNNLVSADRVINTFDSEEDAAKYKINGYNLVIDARPSDAPDKFEAYCESKDGAKEITYEQYLSLPDEEKGGFEFKIRYTPEVLVLNDDLILKYENYLCTTEDSDIKKYYAELTSDKGNLTAEEYKNGVYALNVKAYYPDITAYERLGEVPLLRSYYYLNYLYSSETAKCLFVFDDVLFGYFESDGGIEVAFYGYYNSLQDGKVTADGFITGAFASSVTVSALIYLMNIFRLIPLVALIPLIIALLLKFALTFIKDEKYKKYTSCLKIEFAYLAAASLVTALIVFVCGYFISSDVLNVLPLVILTAVMLIRTAVFLFGEYISIRKSVTETTETTETADTQTE